MEMNHRVGVVGPTTRHILWEGNERNPLFLAVTTNSLETFKKILKSVNIRNSRGYTLLNTVIRHRRVEMFDYLLSLEQIDVNYGDCFKNTPLLCVASYFHEDLALKLIEKGADVHRTDSRGRTFLHISAEKVGYNNFSVGKVVIEKGIDINHKDLSSHTPLHKACFWKNFEWIHMLLYYGADARVHSDEGLLPLNLFMCSQIGPSDFVDKQLLEEILFDYTFDTDDSIPLLVLVAAMKNHSPYIFSKILNYVGHVFYEEEEDLGDVVDILISVKGANFKLFFEKFNYVVKELVESFAILDLLTEKFHSERHSVSREIKNIIQTILTSELGSKFVQSSSHRSVISKFVEMYSESELTRLTETVCLMLSYGLRVTSADLDAVYDRYGFCELFKILLHMDIETDKFLEGANRKHLMAAIFYQPQMTIKNILERVMLYPDLLLYFNDPKLKEYISVEPCGGKIPSSLYTLPRLSFLQNLVRKKIFGSRGTPYRVGKSQVIDTCEDHVAERVRQLPNIPCLVELSRNAARRYIFERFGVKNSRQFYTVIQCLPISTTHKEIISLERMLY